MNLNQKAGGTSMEKEMHLKGNKQSPQEVLAKIDDQDGELNIIFFLENDEYGFGSTYKTDGELPFQSDSLQDRFSKAELCNENFFEMIGEENRRSYIGEYKTNQEAAANVINFWSGMERGTIVRGLNFKEAIELGRLIGMDFIIC